MKYSEEARDIWQVFLAVQRGDYVKRSGFGLCGCYDYNPNEGLNYAHAESDNEHAFGCEELAINFCRFFPTLFTTCDWNRIISLVRYHDLGETKYGDRLDDGSQNHEEKNEVELEAFVEAIKPLPTFYREQLLHDFQCFQKLEVGQKLDPRDYEVISFAKLCDKAHAPLRGGVYQLYGVNGSLQYKKDNHGGITDQDQEYANITGTMRLVDNWTAHFIDHYHKYPHFDMFFAVLCEMMKDIDGRTFPWLSQFIQDKGIGRKYLYGD